MKIQSSRKVLFKYLVSGVTSAFVVLGTTWAFSSWLHNEYESAIGAWLVGAFVSFILQRAWVFTSNLKTRAQVIRFLSGALTSWLLALVSLYVLHTIFGLGILPSQVFVVFQVATTNFVINSAWSFSSQVKS